jgi:glycosyltransferase involved in cell wall biosynthesis
MNYTKAERNHANEAEFTEFADSLLMSATRPMVSLVFPAFNEASIVVANLARLCQYMRGLENRFRWEIVVINDGSTDETGDLADEFAKTNTNVRVFHHITNFGLGQAFKFAFNRCRGEFVVTLDADLSYSPDHIARLLEKIQQTRAKIVVASPYMDGGKISDVPWMRKVFSVGANRFLSRAVNGELSTLTSMVRVYDGRFLRSLNLRAQGMEVMPEIIYKAKLLGARIEEIPAHLDWSELGSRVTSRRSSMRLWRHTVSIILSGFLFRPVMFFILPGMAMLLFAVYVNGWTIAHFISQYQTLSQYPAFFARASAAVSAAYAESPHTFIIGISSLMLGIQLVGLGILALQNKNYFEEIFHLASTIYRSNQESRDIDR